MQNTTGNEILISHFQMYRKGTVIITVNYKYKIILDEHHLQNSSKLHSTWGNQLPLKDQKSNVRIGTIDLCTKTQRISDPFRLSLCLWFLARIEPQIIDIILISQHTSKTDRTIQYGPENLLQSSR